jgi:ribosome-binding ATPase YchF (GTP1/OBG family)
LKVKSEWDSVDKVMDVQKLIAEIIPPSDYQHRNGFSNNHLIDRLSEYEKNQVEDALINKLLTNNEDTLIVETLAYMKSKKSLAILNELLEKPSNNLRKIEKSSNEMSKIIIASSIFENEIRRGRAARYQNQFGILFFLNSVAELRGIKPIRND